MNHYKIKSLESYFKSYKKSVNKPEKFWSNIANKNFIWYKKWEQVLSFNFEKAKFNWFKNAKLNITENAIDRHLQDDSNKTALLFIPNNPEEKNIEITYKQLHEKVCKMANVLISQGVKKGDRVCIYLPMIPELSISMLACARIGAIHSVVFAGFSASSLSSRINDLGCKLIITSDGSFRGNKIIDLKAIVDESLLGNQNVKKVLLVKRTNNKVSILEGRDLWLDSLLEKASLINKPEIMDSEDPLFILYTSGSTGKPKGMVHSTAGYMVYTAYTFKNVFNYQENDVHWCTADLGWITGHSYILYGPLLNGATSLIFEGVPSYPNFNRFWEIIEQNKVNIFYTAPTAIRSLAKESLDFVNQHNLDSLKVIGSVGEPINEEAWNWYNDNIGNKKCPIVDTWWQTETGGIMISPLAFKTPTKPTYATLPLPGIQPCLLDENGKEIKENSSSGNLVIKYPWPSIARTIWGDHERYIQTYFSQYKNYYFCGDGALRDEVGYYRITGRVDDVIIVSGHNLGTGPIEDAINEHDFVAESAIVGFEHEIKGNALYGFVILKKKQTIAEQLKIKTEINELINKNIGPIAKLDKIQFVDGLPKTRSGKIMRRILRKIAEGDFSNFGDTSTLLEPEIINSIKKGRIK